MICSAFYTGGRRFFGHRLQNGKLLERMADKGAIN
jgi:hypothetical protein